MSYRVSPTAPINDLKVCIQESNIILPLPASKTDQKSMFLSNIDQYLDTDVKILHFFTSNPNFSAELAVERLRGAVSESLGPFNFLAGRLKWNTELRRLEIDCSDPVGVGFLVAKSEYAMEEIGDFAYPHPAFEQLVPLDMKRGDDKLLMSLQVTIFKCGSFSLGMTNNHVTFDGMSSKIYFESLATLAANRPLAVMPCNDRRLLAAQSPPQIIIPFHEKLLMPLRPLDFIDKLNPLVVKIFKLSASDIAKLKSKAMKSDQSDEDTQGSSKHVFSRFIVIAALIWKCKALANSILSSNETLDRVSTLCYAVDIRSRLHPPLPQCYVGNAIWFAYATPSTYRELRSCSFRKVVKMVAEGNMKITDEYLRCAIYLNNGDNIEEIFHGECLTTNWCNLGFEKVEYPWGKPKYYCPVNHRRKDVAVMFPGMQNQVGSLSNTNDCGINILVTQSSSEEMNIFEKHFNELLEE